MIRRRVVLVVATMVAALTGCSGPTSAPIQTDWDAWPWMTADIPASVRLAARLSLVTPSAMTSAVMLTFSNSTTNNTQATFGACSFAVRLYRDSTVTGNPVWDNRPPPNADCILPLYVVSLGSRESADRQVGVLDVAAAARALPAGRYRVAVAWRSSATGPVQTVVGEMISLP